MASRSHTAVFMNAITAFNAFGSNTSREQYVLDTARKALLSVGCKLEEPSVSEQASGAVILKGIAVGKKLRGGIEVTIPETMLRKMDTRQNPNLVSRIQAAVTGRQHQDFANRRNGAKHGY